MIILKAKKQAFTRSLENADLKKPLEGGVN